MPIRLRIALLALAAVIGMVSALVIVYRDGHDEITVLETRVTRVTRVQDGSQLVHMLQRERGSSGGFLVNHSAEHATLLSKNRESTDGVLEKLIAAPPTNLRLIPESRLVDLRNRLRETRERVDLRQVNWQFTRDFYTSSIVELMDAIATQTSVRDETSFTLATASVVELAAAREALGLIRATVYYIASQAQPNPRDFVDLAIYYGLFQEHTREFLRGLAPPERETVLPYFRSRAHMRVLASVEAILQAGFISDQVDSSAWWKNATQVIDHFKDTEDNIYRQQIQQATREIDQRRGNLNRYAVMAVAAGLAISLFAALTIIRILRTLGNLSHTLNGVIVEENFTLRVRSSGNDEFSRIGQSLNQLLEFTDSLIRDKERIAATDALTGIMNRRSFMKLAVRELNRANRYGTELSFLFIDIDHFKHVNDTHGHSAGDGILVRFVEVLRKNLRASDLIARWGGEEFIVLAPETSREAGLQFAEKLRQLIAAEDFPVIGHLTCSIGIANWIPGESFDTLSHRADAALYRAKESGRNRVCAANDESQEGT